MCNTDALAKYNILPQDNVSCMGTPYLDSLKLLVKLLNDAENAT